MELFETRDYSGAEGGCREAPPQQSEQPFWCSGGLAPNRGKPDVALSTWARCGLGEGNATWCVAGNETSQGMFSEMKTKPEARLCERGERDSSKPVRADLENPRGLADEMIRPIRAQGMVLIDHVVGEERETSHGKTRGFFSFSRPREPDSTTECARKRREREVSVVYEVQ